MIAAMTDAERARRAGELHDALNAAYPADNHDTLDDRMRVMMLTLSHEEDAPVPQLAVTSRPVPAERSWWRQLLAVLKGWRSA
jgi:hypothetical protein